MTELQANDTVKILNADGTQWGPERIYTGTKTSSGRLIVHAPITSGNIRLEEFHPDSVRLVKRGEGNLIDHSEVRTGMRIRTELEKPFSEMVKTREGVVDQIDHSYGSTSYAPPVRFFNKRSTALSFNDKAEKIRLIKHPVQDVRATLMEALKTGSTIQWDDPKDGVTCIGLKKPSGVWHCLFKGSGYLWTSKQVSETIESENLTFKVLSEGK